jgi:mono/diheme cytochrome c family protein
MSGRCLFWGVAALWCLGAWSSVLAQGTPVPYSAASVARGKTVYLQNCQDCHGEDGKAEGSAIAVAPNLTTPEVWTHGKTDEQLFLNIRNGAGDNMPPFGPLGPGLKDDQIWDLVNFIRSIGPASLRPK